MYTVHQAGTVYQHSELLANSLVKLVDQTLVVSDNDLHYESLAIILEFLLKKNPEVWPVFKDKGSFDSLNIFFSCH